MKLRQYFALWRFTLLDRLGVVKVAGGVSRLGETAGLADALSASESDFRTVEKRLSDYGLNSLQGAVLSLDAQILYSLCKAKAPKSVLEIGTYVGHSTAYLASALGEGARITTVDIMDVNEDPAAPWKKEGLTKPAEVMKDLGVEVNFHVSSATEFFRGNKERFDLVFVDGDHSYAAALNDIGYAIEAIADGGLIVLHDYFGPGNDPLETGTTPHAGVGRAIEHLINRYPDIEVLAVQSVVGKGKSSLGVLGRKGTSA